MTKQTTVIVESRSGEILRSADPRVVAAAVNAAVDCVQTDSTPNPAATAQPKERASR